MSVDVFGRTDFASDSTRAISRGINMKQANDTFLRRDGGNATASDIDLDSHKLINVADPTNDTKNMLIRMLEQIVSTQVTT